MLLNYLEDTVLELKFRTFNLNRKKEIAKRHDRMTCAGVLSLMTFIRSLDECHKLCLELKLLERYPVDLILESKLLLIKLQL